MLVTRVGQNMTAPARHRGAPPAERAMPAERRGPHDWLDTDAGRWSARTR